MEWSGVRSDSEEGTSVLACDALLEFEKLFSVNHKLLPQLEDGVAASILRSLQYLLAYYERNIYALHLLRGRGDITSGAEAEETG